MTTSSFRTSQAITNTGAHGPKWDVIGDINDDAIGNIINSDGDIISGGGHDIINGIGDMISGIIGDIVRRARGP